MIQPHLINAEILVVDDTQASLDLLTELLTQAGYTVRPAQDGRMALRSALARPPELILLDVRMPDMDGFEVCRHLKTEPSTRDIPVIFLSALRETTDKVLGFEVGAVDYIAKPYQPEEVLARVRTHVELRRLQSRLEERVAERTAQLFESEAQLRESRARLQELAAFLQTVREEERTAISRELHDELGQALTALRIDLGWLRNKCNSLGKPVTDRIVSAYSLVEQTIEASRRISEGLRPGMLDVLGLAAAIEHHIDQFRNRSGLNCTLTMNRDEFDLDNRLAITIFRVIQEALTNVSRHAFASQVTICLEETEDRIYISVEDNGCGFDPGLGKKTFGLIGMQERIKMFNGEIEIIAKAGHGTYIRASLPTKQEKEP